MVDLLFFPAMDVPIHMLLAILYRLGDYSIPLFRVLTRLLIQIHLLWNYFLLGPAHHSREGRQSHLRIHSLSTTADIGKASNPSQSVRGRESFYFLLGSSPQLLIAIALFYFNRCSMGGEYRR